MIYKPMDLKVAEDRLHALVLKFEQETSTLGADADKIVLMVISREDARAMLQAAASLASFRAAQTHFGKGDD